MTKAVSKEKPLNFTAENLAVPEVHVEGNSRRTRKKASAKEAEDKELVIDNLAVPEYRPKCKLRKKNSKLKK